jgi:ATP-dependent DNA helicase RecQ
MAPAKQIQQRAKQALGIAKLRYYQGVGRDRTGRRARCRLRLLPARGPGDPPLPRGAWSSPKPTSSASFEIGATVTHSEWGPGEVQRYDGDRVVVLFESVGYRTLEI